MLGIIEIYTANLPVTIAFKTAGEKSSTVSDSLETVLSVVRK
jgi:hypothetical protein